MSVSSGVHECQQWCVAPWLIGQVRALRPVRGRPTGRRRGWVQDCARADADGGYVTTVEATALTTAPRASTEARAAPAAANPQNYRSKKHQNPHRRTRPGDSIEHRGDDSDRTACWNVENVEAVCTREVG